jgi:hypothetical protein
MVSLISTGGSLEEFNVHSGKIISHKTKLKKPSVFLSIEGKGPIEKKSLVDDIDLINSDGIGDGLISEYERELKDLEKDFKWDEHERRPISQLVLKKWE